MTLSDRTGSSTRRRGLSTSAGTVPQGSLPGLPFRPGLQVALVAPIAASLPSPPQTVLCSRLSAELAIGEENIARTHAALLVKAQEMDPEATVFFTPCAVPHLYLPPPPSPIIPLMPHYLVLCPYAVRPGYAYPSALLWVDLLINKVGPCQILSSSAFETPTAPRHATCPLKRARPPLSTTPYRYGMCGAYPTAHRVAGTVVHFLINYFRQKWA